MLTGPEQIVTQISFPAKAQIADIGAGTGHYARVLAQRVARIDGKVFAIDIQKDLLDRLKHDAIQHNLDNIEIVWGDAELPKGTRLRDDSMDMVFLTNTLFQIPDKQGVAQEIRRILHTQGLLVVVDWSDSFGGLGPQENDIITAEQVKELFTAHGFVYDKDIDAGDHHYAVTFRLIQ